MKEKMKRYLDSVKSFKWFLYNRKIKVSLKISYLKLAVKEKKKFFESVDGRSFRKIIQFLSLVNFGDN